MHHRPDAGGVSRRSPKEQFASRLRKLRLSAGLSQEALGHAAGVDRTFIGRLERAEKQPSLDTLVRLARALGMTASDLVEGIR